MQRKEILVTSGIYHIMSKSIAGYSVFTSETEYTRMVQTLRFFVYESKLPKFSRFLISPAVQEHGFERALQQSTSNNDKLVQLIAYCLMPTHIHLVVKQLKDNGISLYAGNILNTYAKYFNTKHNRKGHLWSDRFKNVTVESDEQLLHLSRYIHLNPISAGLVNDAGKWKYSSYAEYARPQSIAHPLCDFRSLIGESPENYRTFVRDHASYQKELAKIKKLALE